MKMNLLRTLIKETIIDLNNSIGVYDHQGMRMFFLYKNQTFDLSYDYLTKEKIPFHNDEVYQILQWQLLRHKNLLNIISQFPEIKIIIAKEYPHEDKRYTINEFKSIINDTIKKYEIEIQEEISKQPRGKLKMVSSIESTSQNTAHIDYDKQGITLTFQNQIINPARFLNFEKIFQNIPEDDIIEYMWDLWDKPQFKQLKKDLIDLKPKVQFVIDSEANFEDSTYSFEEPIPINRYTKLLDKKINQ